MNKIEYLGQIINHERRRPNPKRTEAMKNIPILDKVTKLQSFLGLANYYNLYIPHHHHVVPQARISLTLSHHFSLNRWPSGRVLAL